MCNSGSTGSPNACPTVDKQNGIPRKPWIRSEIFHFGSLVEGQCNVKRKKVVERNCAHVLHCLKIIPNNAYRRLQNACGEMEHGGGNI